MNTPINTPRYNTIKRMTATQTELGNQLRTYQSRLWQYIETTPSHSHNAKYINYLETNIQELKALLKPIDKAA